MHRIFHGSRGRAAKDLLILAALCLFGFVASMQLNLFERFVRFSRAHQGWQLDDMVTIVAILAVAGFVFAVRRSRDLGGELAGREAAEAHIRDMALHDPLTGLANRRKMQEALEQALKTRKTGDQVTALLMIDLDRFKPVNDLHGHGVGDRLLEAVGERLHDAVRTGEIVARMGGDEFAILIATAHSAGACGRLAGRILRAMETPFEIDRLVLQIGASVGIVVTADTQLDAETAIHHADVALYRAKREGRGQFRFFEEKMDGQIRARARLELEFRRSLMAGAVQPFYHPLVELSSGRIKGYEILARWDHPTDGMIQPDVFIPIAEDTGLIGEMTMRLLRQACQDARAWEPGMSLALNISPMQLRDPLLPDRLLAILEETGFAPERLEVEVTEDALVDDFEAAKRILNALKARGVQIALDDFGTGYSSLHHLRELPFDTLKIDRSFIMSMSESEESRKIVDAIIGLGHSLGLITVAEGIENAESADRLLALGCEMGQGFLYGRPAAEVGKFDKKDRRRVA